jgi:hypothetical protein
MANYVSVAFCNNCGSRYVEVGKLTKDGKTLIYCRSCKSSEEISSFTLGRGSISDAELQKARDTRAFKSKPER